MAEMTIYREPYLGDLHTVKFYDDKTGRVLEYLQTPQEILDTLQQDNNLDVAFVHFVGGPRANRTYHRPTSRKEA